MAEKTANGRITKKSIIRKRRLYLSAAYNDPLIRQILDHSDYRGQSFGYVSYSFQEEFTDDKVMEKAKRSLEYCKNTIVKMHRFVISSLKEKSIN